MTKRYFFTRGPATVNDFAWWSGLTVSDAKRGIEITQPKLKNEALNGRTYWFAESSLPKTPKKPIVHLLPNYDEYFIGFKDRSAIGERLGESHVKMDGSAFLAHLVFVNGQLVGGWKRTTEKKRAAIELELVVKLSDVEKKMVADAAERFGKFLGLPVALSHKNRSSK